MSGWSWSSGCGRWKGEFDFEGKYYTVRKAAAEPKPIQKPYPLIINAAVSPRGRQFSAQHADVLFTSGEMGDLAAQVSEMRRLAREESQREIVDPVVRFGRGVPPHRKGSSRLPAQNNREG